jgi:hypothetical protein
VSTAAEFKFQCCQPDRVIALFLVRYKRPGCLKKSRDGSCGSYLRGLASALYEVDPQLSGPGGPADPPRTGAKQKTNPSQSIKTSRGMREPEIFYTSPLAEDIVWYSSAAVLCHPPEMKPAEYLQSRSDVVRRRNLRRRSDRDHESRTALKAELDRAGILESWRLEIHRKDRRQCTFALKRAHRLSRSLSPAASFRSRDTLFRRSVGHINSNRFRVAPNLKFDAAAPVFSPNPERRLAVEVWDGQSDEGIGVWQRRVFALKAALAAKVHALNSAIISFASTK